MGTDLKLLLTLLVTSSALWGQAAMNGRLTSSGVVSYASGHVCSTTDASATAGLQALFDAAQQTAEITGGNGGAVYCVGGAVPLILPSNKTVVGQGPAVVALQAIPATQYPVTLTYTGTGPYTVTVTANSGSMNFPNYTLYNQGAKAYLTSATAGYTGEQVVPVNTSVTSFTYTTSTAPAASSVAGTLYVGLIGMQTFDWRNTVVSSNLTVRHLTFDGSCAGGNIATCNNPGQAGRALEINATVSGVNPGALTFDDDTFQNAGEDCIRYDANASTNATGLLTIKNSTLQDCSAHALEAYSVSSLDIHNNVFDTYGVQNNITSPTSTADAMAFRFYTGAGPRDGYNIYHNTAYNRVDDRSFFIEDVDSATPADTGVIQHLNSLNNTIYDFTGTTQGGGSSLEADFSKFVGNRVVEVNAVTTGNMGHTNGFEISGTNDSILNNDINCGSIVFTNSANYNINDVEVAGNHITCTLTQTTQIDAPIAISGPTGSNTNTWNGLKVHDNVVDVNLNGTTSNQDFLCLGCGEGSALNQLNATNVAVYNNTVITNGSYQSLLNGIVLNGTGSSWRVYNNDLKNNLQLQIRNGGATKISSIADLVVNNNTTTNTSGLLSATSPSAQQVPFTFRNNQWNGLAHDYGIGTAVIPATYTSVAGSLSGTVVTFTTSNILTNKFWFTTSASIVVSGCNNADYDGTYTPTSALAGMASVTVTPATTPAESTATGCTITSNQAALDLNQTNTYNIAFGGATAIVLVNYTAARDINLIFQPTSDTVTWPSQLVGTPTLSATAVTPAYYLANGTTFNYLPPGSGGGGTGTVTSVSVTTANGVSGTVTNPTTTPAISLALGAITPTSVNGAAITSTGSATTYLNGAGAYTTPAGGGSSPLLFANTTIAAGDTVTGTGPFATGYTFAANSLTVGEVFSATSAGTLSNSGGVNTIALGFELGTTPIETGKGIFPGGSAAAGQQYYENVHCTVLSVGTAGTLECHGLIYPFGYSNGAITTDQNTAPITINTTVSNVLAGYVATQTTATGNNVAQRQLIVTTP